VLAEETAAPLEPPPPARHAPLHAPKHARAEGMLSLSVKREPGAGEGGPWLTADQLLIPFLIHYARRGRGRRRARSRRGQQCVAGRWRWRRRGADLRIRHCGRAAG